MVTSVKPPSGAFISRHKFGRSVLVRQGHSVYYIQWQVRGKKTATTIIIDRQLYERINRLLLPAESVAVEELTDKSRVYTYSHRSTSAVYMRVRRLLLQQGLLKEELQSGRKTLRVLSRGD